MKNTYLLIITLFAISFFACSSDDDDPQGRVTNFTVPELTNENSIQFTVTANAKNSLVLLGIHGRRVAVDWGDDTEIEKDDLTKNRGENYDDRESFPHVYRSNGIYTIKVWSTEMTQFSLDGDWINKSYLIDNLAIGTCPILESLYLTGLDMAELTFKSNMSNLTLLNLQAMDNITSLDISDLYNLDKLYLTNLPKLEQLNVSRNRKLWELSCSNLPEISFIGLENNKELARFTLLDCTKLTNLDLKGATGLATVEIGRTPLVSLDISKQIDLADFSCYKTNLTSLDISNNIKLYSLSIVDNKLMTLDITKNIYLMRLNCYANQLTALDVSQNKEIEILYISGNRFNTEELNNIFTKLPKSKYTYTKSLPPPKYSYIEIFDNPGVEACNTKIITDKGWILKDKK